MAMPAEGDQAAAGEGEQVGAVQQAPVEGEQEEVYDEKEILKEIDGKIKQLSVELACAIDRSFEVLAAMQGAAQGGEAQPAD